MRLRLAAIAAVFVLNCLAASASAATTEIQLAPGLDASSQQTFTYTARTTYTITVSGTLTSVQGATTCVYDFGYEKCNALNPTRNGSGIITAAPASGLSSGGQAFSDYASPFPAYRDDHTYTFTYTQGTETRQAGFWAKPAGKPSASTTYSGGFTVRFAGPDQAPPAPAPSGSGCPAARSAFAFAAACPPLARLGQVTRPMPAPGTSVAVSSPRSIDPSARRADTSVTTSSGGGLAGTTTVAESADERRTRLGNAVAACYLIGPDALDLPASSMERLEDPLFIRHLATQTPAQRLRLCIGLITLIGQVDAAETRATAAAAGCRATRVEITVRRNRRGRIVSAHAARRGPGPRDVRYSCSLGAPGTMTVTVDGRRRGGLRKGVGSKLRFGVYRARRAAPDSGRLTFGFGV